MSVSYRQAKIGVKLYNFIAEIQQEYIEKTGDHRNYPSTAQISNKLLDYIIKEKFKKAIIEDNGDEKISPF